jgi:hypothetical protein
MHLGTPVSGDPSGIVSTYIREQNTAFETEHRVAIFSFLLVVTHLSTYDATSAIIWMNLNYAKEYLYNF